MKSKPGLDINEPSGRIRAPLHYACDAGNFSTVKLLLELGAKADVADQNRYTPFLIAVSRFHWDIAKFVCTNYVMELI